MQHFIPFGLQKKTAFAVSVPTRLEKKGTACGCSASERGDKPRSGTLLHLRFLMLPTPSYPHKKRPLSSGPLS